MSEPSDDELRQLWCDAGGRFHGPNVETGTMPEAKLLPFLRALRSRAEPGETVRDASASDSCALEFCRLSRECMYGNHCARLNATPLIRYSPHGGVMSTDDEGPWVRYAVVTELMRKLTAALAPASGEDARDAAIHRNDCPTYRAFFERYALGPKAAPSCLVCGHSMQGKQPKIEHAELPGIVVCEQCVDAARRA